MTNYWKYYNLSEISSCFVSNNHTPFGWNAPAFVIITYCRHYYHQYIFGSFVGNAHLITFLNITISIGVTIRPWPTYLSIGNPSDQDQHSYWFKNKKSYWFQLQVLSLVCDERCVCVCVCYFLPFSQELHRGPIVMSVIWYSPELFWSESRIARFTEITWLRVGFPVKKNPARKTGMFFYCPR